MGGFFNLDNAFFATINKIVDMILLSIVYVIICIPIITIGPATTALYYVTVKVIRRERSYVFREFFKSFKRNFKQGTISNLIFILMYLILYVDIQFSNQMEGLPGLILSGIFIAILLILIGVNIYIYPVLSRFDIGIKQLFKNSFFMSVRHLLSTIVMFLILAAILFITWLIPLTILITPALYILLISLLMEKVFRKYMPEKSEEAKADGIDEWYLE